MAANLDIKLPEKLDFGLVPTVVEDVCAGANLHATMKATLKKFPRSTHWHFKKEKEKGILEVTWWPRDMGEQTSRLWISVHGNRTADWIVQFKPQLKALIEERLSEYQTSC